MCRERERERDFMFYLSYLEILILDIIVLAMPFV